MRSNICMIHYVVNHLLFPRKTNSSHLNKVGVATIWFLENSFEKNWDSKVIHYMMGIKKKNMILPCGGLIMKILEHVSFDLEDKESNNKFSGIRNNTLSRMRVTINNRVPSHLPTKARIRRAPQKAEKANTKDFDYEIPHTSPTNALLNTILENQQVLLQINNIK